MPFRTLLCLALFLSLVPLTSGCSNDRRGVPVPMLDGGMTADGGMAGDASMMLTDSATSTSPLVDPSCIDGMYSEPLPTPEASIEDLTSSFNPTEVQAFVNAALERRYPTGQAIVAAGLANTRLGNCIERFAGSPGTANDAIQRMSTIVHECGHFADLASGFGSDTYLIHPELTITCSMGDAVEREGRTIARSRITTDDQAALRPACGGVRSSGCDFYADVYLGGDPDDANFDGGDQGFNSLMEEATQYVNSLATGYAFNDYYVGSRSERDGILTFLWYIERYLRHTRLMYPDAYAFISGDPCWRRIILTVWGRAWLYLETTRGHSALGINDAAIEALVVNPELLAEIDRIRDAEGCGG